MQNVKLVRIDYWVEKAEAGVHFRDNVLHTDSQIRRAHCWFPCMDDSLQRCCYDLEITVPHNLVAVSNGSLLYQVLSKDDPPRKTFVYKLNVPVSARWISLSVAPFQILPDYHSNLLSHMCLTGNLSKLQNTVGFFHSAFRHYELYLEAPFPFGSYKQVFIAPEMVISSATLGASMGIFSSQILFDEKVIDQTIDTRIKLAYALARQWFGLYITPETPNDEWLVNGLAGFLTDTFVREFLGNNEARYRRYKANCAVCKADDGGATTLSPSGSKDLYGTQSIGLYGRIRSWKSVAILQMLEKQMGPDLFKEILRTIVSRAQDATRFLRTLSTKEFRHFANKLGNLERPFLKEFFHRWVETCGCPVLRMGFTYNKRKNMVELAASRECTAPLIAIASAANGNTDSDNREGDSGWPGMMTIKVHELDGTHDHLLPMAGDAWQLLEIKCHSRLAAKRFQKPKKGSKPDGSDDNGDAVTTVDMRASTESPLLWVRADPEMEYLAEIHFNQPLQMWINQLEKDKDVVAQAQAIATLEELPNIPFPVINALTNVVGDSKAFWRVRIEAAFALAKTASEGTDWAGMLHLVKYYRAKRFDPSIGLPKPNDFHDFPEYFVLEAIPHAVATVRTVDNKSPREAVEFILQLLKYNDNSGNPYSDVFWLAALVEAIGELEFGQQSILLLSSLLKRIDRLLQFDRLMSSYNGILTISCIRTLTQMALKLSEFVPLDRVIELIKSFRDFKAMWQVRIEAARALLDLEFHCKGIDAALMLFMKFLEEELSLRGQAKLGVHMIRLSQISAGSGSNGDLKSQTLVALLRLLESRVAFCNVFLRHHLFCILQVLAGRCPTLYVIPRDHMQQMGYAEICSEQRNNFLAFINQMKPPEPLLEIHSPSHNGFVVPEVSRDADTISNNQEPNMPAADGSAIPEGPRDVDAISNSHNPKIPVDGLVVLEGPRISNSQELKMPVDGLAVPEGPRISNSQEQKMPVVKIRVKQTATSNKGDEADNVTHERSQAGPNNEHDPGASSSVSVDAPQRNFPETVSVSNQIIIEEVNSCQDRGSHMTASISSAKIAREDDQCTADSSNIAVLPPPPDPDIIIKDDFAKTDEQKHEVPPQTVLAAAEDVDGGSLSTADPGKKKKRKDKKRKRDDPEYLERKRLKKEKKQKEKEGAKLLEEKREEPPVKMDNGRKESGHTVRLKPNEDNGPKLVLKTSENKQPAVPGGTSGHKLRIKIKNRTIDKS